MLFLFEHTINCYSLEEISIGKKIKPVLNAFCGGGYFLATANSAQGLILFLHLGASPGGLEE